jgi:hypothetical protein
VPFVKSLRDWLDAQDDAAACGGAILHVVRLFCMWLYFVPAVATGVFRSCKCLVSSRPRPIRGSELTKRHCKP